MNTQQGFSIIELMMTVAVLGIIMAIAIPLYTDYQNRAKVTEAIYLLGAMKKPMIEYYDMHGVWPMMDKVGAKTRGRYVSTLISGAPETYMEVLMKKDGTDLSETQIRHYYFPDKGGDWICSTEGTARPILEKFLPAPCRGNVLP